MEGLLVVGGLSIFAYNVFYGGGTPKPEDGSPPGTQLPPPNVLWSEPRLWISAPVDITYRDYRTFTGPNNDPRRAYLLYGGVRVSHSGYNPVVQTNQVWEKSLPAKPSGKPGYTASPVRGIGEAQIPTTQSVFNQ